MDKNTEKINISKNIIDILLKQYDLLWQNIRHNESVRDHMYNFYLLAFSFLMLGAFHLVGIIQNFLPELSQKILLYPFLIISFIGIITIAIQSRLRMVLNRDIKASDSIREFLILHNPSMKQALNIISSYFKKRERASFHRYFNLNRLIIYLIFGTILFSSGIGTYISTSSILFTIISILISLLISFFVWVLFEKQSFYETKLSEKKLY